MFNQPGNPVPPNKTVDHVSMEEYASLSNVLAQMMAAINNLRNKTFDMMDRFYEIQNILSTHPEYIDKLLPELGRFKQTWKYAYARFIVASAKIQLEVSIQADQEQLSILMDSLSTNTRFC